MGIPHYIDITDHLRHVRDLFLPSNSRARYVELHQDGTADYYPLCEVEVYGIQDEATNVALRKTSQMSSINSENLFDQSLAVDGITEQNMLKGSCFYTAEEDNPWWRVDLAGIYVIFLVRLYNRLDCCSYDTHDVLLKVGTSLGTMINASEVAGQIEDIQNIYLPINTEARFIELIRKGWGVFHLCEVEVFGKIAVCKFDPCQNGGNCSVIHCDDLDNCRNYTCACADGFGGVDCESCTYNVAVGKQIEASSIHHKSWQPSNVIDGDTNQNVLLGATCFSTQKAIKPYVMLDLGDEYNLTGVNVYKRLDCCEEDNYAIELFLMMTTWTSYGYTDGPVERIAEFGIYPYVATKYVKLEAKEQRPTFLQLCEIEVFSICEEDITTTTSTVPETMAEQSVPLIQMRFSLSDKYSDVVKSEKLFKKLIRHGLSSQTGYSEESFRNIQLEKEPFRVSFELHASDRKRTSLNEMLEKIETLNRFGILDIENEDGQLLAITAGSLQYHLLFVENKGTRIEKTILVAVSIIVTAMRYM
ncbi:uncharacterized protein LOC123534535 [Mercenaria mercenaria]|uniref:uncharacterized protein LOC123534535 n=1 Tax=Mercenaria mercenaria TaxID=6596 RepID=UPI00234F3C4E|nr:uncharacterized protein LOC123534535 [Mercenaria mercenaria]